MSKPRCTSGPLRWSLGPLLALAATGCVGPFDDNPDLGQRSSPQHLSRIEPLALPPAPPTTQQAAPTTSPGSGPATAPAEMQLTIEECRALALEHSLDLKVQLLSPAIAATSISEERARFESLFTTDLSYATTNQPVPSQLEGSKTNSFSITPGLRLPLETGGQVNLNLPLNRFETDNAFATLNPAYTADFSASISQPLLRNAGVRTNTAGIRIAQYNWRSTWARTRLEVIRVLADTDRAYWVLDALRREREVRRNEYNLALAQLQKVQRQVRAGALAEVEIIRSEAGLAEAAEALIVAQNRLSTAQRLLKRLINKPDLPLEGSTVIIPATAPNPLRFDLNPDRLLASALRDRMEMLDLELQLAADAASIDVARNQKLPLVLLDYSYNIGGLGPDFGRALDMLSTADFPGHRVGVHGELPLGNEAAESRFRRALLNRLQRLATRDQRAAQIRQEVLDALDTLEGAWERILAARQRALTATRNLQAEQRQFDLGLRTSTDVLDAQTRLADAQSSEVRAVADYQIAQVDLAFATGTILGATQVTWEPADPPTAP